jgi:hypothetical protein
MDPFGVADLKSWLLFVMGCAFSLMAAIDGFKMDDPYPGYGPLYRCYSSILNDYTEFKQNLMSDLESIRDNAHENMANLAKDIEKRQSQYHALLHSSRNLEQNFQQHLLYLEQCANNLLSFYRASNGRSQTNPVPNHFSQHWKLSTSIEPDSDSHVISVEHLKEEIGRTFSELQEKRERINAEYEQALFRYRKIEELTGDNQENGIKEQEKA